jgi:two-component system response regulator TctD
MLLLPPREAEVLEVLLKRNGRTVSQDVLESQVFGMSQNISSNAIEVYVHRLRRMLADAGANLEIHTIRGVGYLMELAKDHPESTGKSAG